MCKLLVTILLVLSAGIYSLDIENKRENTVQLDEGIKNQNAKLSDAIPPNEKVTINSNSESDKLQTEGKPATPKAAISKEHIQTLADQVLAIHGVKIGVDDPDNIEKARKLSKVVENVVNNLENKLKQTREEAKLKDINQVQATNEGGTQEEENASTEGLKHQNVVENVVKKLENKIKETEEEIKSKDINQVKVTNKGVTQEEESISTKEQNVENVARKLENKVKETKEEIKLKDIKQVEDNVSTKSTEKQIKSGDINKVTKDTTTPEENKKLADNGNKQSLVQENKTVNINENISEKENVKTVEINTEEVNVAPKVNKNHQEAAEENINIQNSNDACVKGVESVKDVEEETSGKHDVKDSNIQSVEANAGTEADGTEHEKAVKQNEDAEENLETEQVQKIKEEDDKVERHVEDVKEDEIEENGEVDEGQESEEEESITTEEIIKSYNSEGNDYAQDSKTGHPNLAEQNSNIELENNDEVGYFDTFVHFIYDIFFIN